MKTGEGSGQRGRSLPDFVAQQIAHQISANSIHVGSISIAHYLQLRHGVTLVPRKHGTESHTTCFLSPHLPNNRRQHLSHNPPMVHGTLTLRLLENLRILRRQNVLAAQPGQEFSGVKLQSRWYGVHTCLAPQKITLHRLTEAPGQMFLSTKDD